MDESQAAYIAMEVLIAALSVLGNVLVVCAVLLDGALRRDTTFRFVVSLALADVAVGALVIPLAVTLEIGPRMAPLSCLAATCVMLVLTQSSILALLAIAVDRYLRVKIPMSYKRVVTPWRAGIAVVLCWMVSFLVGLTPMGWNQLEGDAGGGELVNCTFEGVISMEYMVYFNFFGWVLLPLLLMLLLYIEIFYIIHKHLSKKVTANHTDFQRRPDYGKELKLAKSLALVLFLFTVSWLPLHVLNCVTLFCPSCVPKSYLYGPILLTHVNSAVNPVVYAFHINKFRTAFRKIWERYILCRDPVGRLPQKGSQRGWTHKGRLRQNCDDRDGL